MATDRFESNRMAVGRLDISPRTRAFDRETEDSCVQPVIPIYMKPVRFTILRLKHFGILKAVSVS